MKPASSYKLRGTICQSIGIILYCLLIGFGTYLFFVNNINSLGVIVLDLYVGIVGIIFSTIGIFAIYTMNERCLDLNRAYTLISALFCIFFTVIHCIIPIYNDFDVNAYAVFNTFYVAASGFIASFIQNLYSFYITISLFKIKRAETIENDIESMGDKNNALNDTDINYRMDKVY